jgi:nitrate reductase gamma subunit
VELLTYVILPYLTVVVFIWGLVWRIRTWWARPRAGAVLYPAAKNKRNVVAQVLGDIFFFRKTLSVSPPLWAMAILFHLGLLLVALGHLRTIFEPGFLWGWFGLDKQGIDNVSIMLIGGILLFSRRFTPKMRILSIFQDYFVLSMLLVIVFLGISMRLWAPLHAGDVQHYVRGALTLRPAVEISNVLFLWHIFFAQVLIMYLPFSKLIHIVSKPVAESWTMR